MYKVKSAPVTATVFAAMTILLYGCMAYHAASTVVDAGATVVSTSTDVIKAPFGSDEPEDK